MSESESDLDIYEMTMVDYDKSGESDESDESDKSDESDDEVVIAKEEVDGLKNVIKYDDLDKPLPGMGGGKSKKSKKSKKIRRIRRTKNKKRKHKKTKYNKSKI